MKKLLKTSVYVLWIQGMTKHINKWIQISFKISYNFVCILTCPYSKLVYPERLSPQSIDRLCLGPPYHLITLTRPWVSQYIEMTDGIGMDSFRLIVTIEPLVVITHVLKCAAEQWPPI